MPAPQVTLLETDGDLQLFLPSDIYRFDIDNRPLRNLLINDEALRDVLNPLSTEVYNARTNLLPFSYPNLKARLDDMDLNSGYPAKLVLFDLMYEQAAMYRAQFASGWFCRTGDVFDQNDLEINWQNYGDAQIPFGAIAVKNRIPGETTLLTTVPDNSFWITTQQSYFGPVNQPLEVTVAGFHVRLANESANGAAPSGFPQGVSVLLPAPGGSQRFDFVFLEVWFAPVSKALNVASDTSSFYPYGAVNSNAPRVTDPTDPTVRGTVYFYPANNGDYVQMRHRIRVVSGIDALANPAGMSDSGVHPQGGAPVPVTNKTYSVGLSIGDPGSWLAGQPNDLSFNSVDGMVYATPICIVSRRNGMNWTLFNPNGGIGRPDGLTASDLASCDILDLRQRAFTDRTNIGQLADETFDRIMRGKLRSTMGELFYDGTSSAFGAQDDARDVYGTEILSADYIGPAKVAGTNTVMDFTSSGPVVSAPDGVQRVFSPAPGDTQATGFHVPITGGPTAPSNLITYSTSSHLITVHFSNATFLYPPVMSWRGSQLAVKLTGPWSNLGTSSISATLDTTDAAYIAAYAANDYLDGAVTITLTQTSGIRHSPNRVDYQEYVSPTAQVTGSTRMRGMKSPFGLVVDPGGNIYACDTAQHRVVKYDPNGNFLAQFGVTGVAGSDNSHLKYPTGIAIDAAVSGNVIISDSGNHRVIKVTPNNPMQFVSQFGTGVAGGGTTQLNHPTGVAATFTGNFYVSDWGNNRIIKLGPSMNWLGIAFPDYNTDPAPHPGNDDHHVYSPQQMSFRDTANGGDTLLYVADTIRVLVFDPTNLHLLKIITSGQGLPESSQAAALSNLNSVASCEDSSGNLYVATIGAVYKFNSSLQLLARFGDPATLWQGDASDTTHCNAVASVVLDPTNNSVWITDYNAGYNPFQSRILVLNTATMTYKYQLLLKNPRPWHTPNIQPPFPPPWAAKMAFDRTGRYLYIPISDHYVVEKWSCPSDNPSGWTYQGKYGEVSSIGTGWIGWRNTADNQKRLAHPEVVAVDSSGANLFIGDLQVAGGNNQTLQVAARIVKVTTSTLAYADSAGDLTQINVDSGPTTGAKPMMQFVSGIVVKDPSATDGGSGTIYVSDPYSVPPRVLVLDYSTLIVHASTGVVSDPNWKSVRQGSPSGPNYFVTANGISNDGHTLYINTGSDTQRWDITSGTGKNVNPARLYITTSGATQYRTQFEEQFVNVISVYQHSNALLIADYIQNMIYAISTPDYYPIGKIGVPRVSSFGGGGMALPTGVAYNGVNLFFSDQFNNHVVKASPYFAYVERGSGRIETLFPLPIGSTKRIYTRFTPYQGISERPSFSAGLAWHHDLKFAGSRTIHAPTKLLVTTRGRVDIEGMGLGGDTAYANPLAHLPLPVSGGMDYDWNGQKIPFDNTIGLTDFALLPILSYGSSPNIFASDSESFFDPQTLFTTSIQQILTAAVISGNFHPPQTGQGPQTPGNPPDAPSNYQVALTSRGFSTYNGINEGVPTIHTFNIGAANFARLAYFYCVIEYLGELLLFVRGELLSGPKNGIALDGINVNNVVEVYRLHGQPFVRHWETRTP